MGCCTTGVYCITLDCLLKADGAKERWKRAVIGCEELSETGIVSEYGNMGQGGMHCTALHCSEIIFDQRGEMRSGVGDANGWMIRVLSTAMHCTLLTLFVNFRNRQLAFS